MATCVGGACKAFRERPYNEADSLHKLRSVIGDFLFELNSLTSSEHQLLSLKTTMDSRRNPSTITTATALVRLKRPDFAVYILNALILRWENKFEPAGLEISFGRKHQKIKSMELSLLR